MEIWIQMYGVICLMLLVWIPFFAGISGERDRSLVVRVTFQWGLLWPVMFVIMAFYAFGKWLNR